MELHVCRNCQMINQVIGTQTQKFSVLSEENLILHNLLIQARQSLRELSEKLLKSHEALIAEREYNLQLYLKKQADSYKNLSNGNTEKGVRKEMKTNNEHTRSENNMPGNDNTTLLKFIADLQLKQQSNLDTIHDENARHSKILNEHIYQAEEHVAVILELNKSLRDDLFYHKKQSNIDRQEFLKTVDMLTAANEKYIQDVKQSILLTTTKTADKLTKHAINSMCHQLNERDKLVAILRRQQTLLQGQIDLLQKREKTLKEENSVVTHKLKSSIKYEQDKQAGLEQRRKFDAEGFRTDIRNIYQDIRSITKKFQKPPVDVELMRKCEQLVKDTDKVSQRLNSLYSMSEPVL